jgi:hypothetical protein
MVSRLGRLGSVVILAAAVAAPAWASVSGPTVGKMAPDFTGVDSNGKTVRLSDYRGRLVVLEWTNDGCPYVRKHYRSGNMQRVQRAARRMGAVWLSVISSAPGRQGYVDGAGANALTRDRNAAPSRVVLDPKGVIGRKYEASNTPHMFIVGPKGKLLYMGAIDDKPTAWGDPKGAKNYVLAALGEIKAGKPVTTASTQAYGCTVKYAY